MKGIIEFVNNVFFKLPCFLCEEFGYRCMNFINISNYHMVKNIFVTLLLFLLITGKSTSQTPLNDKNWSIFFEDNFDGQTVNTSKWRFSPPWGNCDCGSTLTSGKNHEVGNGIVKLVAKKETSICKMWDETKKLQLYTSGALVSNALYKYGYIEIMCKIPELSNSYYTGEGFSPNFWMWPVEPDAYENTHLIWSEIDIFEINAKKNLHTCNIHYEDTYNDNCNIETPFWSLRRNESFDFIVNFNVFHKFACEWTPNFISFYFDDRLIRTSYTEFAKDLLPMNLFIGISTPANNFQNAIQPNTLFPYKFEIDYVRVYKLKMDCSTDISQSVFAYSTFDNKVKRNITVGGSGGKMLSGQNISLRATNAILLNDGFEVPIGSSFYANNCDCE